ncbi:CsiV family protein [Kaarinaea lacus]
MGPCNPDTNNIKNRLLTVLFMLFPGLALSAAPATSPDFSEERWFQVELIIFAHNNRDALESEDWPKISGLSLPDNLVDLTFPPVEEPAQKNSNASAPEPTLIFEPVSQPGESIPGLENGENQGEPVPMPVAFQMLPKKELQLKDEYRRLARSSRFKPLLHVAWRQPTFDRDHAQPVLLYEGMTEPVEDLTDHKDKSKSGNLPSEQDASIGPISPRVIGTVRLSVARYLHLAADLVYRTEVIEREAVQLPDLELWYDRPYPTLAQHQGPAYQLKQWHVIDGFQLEESRRMRSKKIHYLDHPFFGVVVLVTPVELPTKQEQAIPDPMRNISLPDS